MVKVNHDLRSVNSGTIYLPPNATIGNMAIPNLAAIDTVQQYDLTTKYRYNSKTFVYCRGVVHGAGGEYAGAQLIAHKGAVSASVMAITYATDNVHSHDAGVSQVVIEKSGVAKDEYKYGHVILGHQSNTTVMNRGIIGNTKSDSDGYVTLDLDIPLQVKTVHDTTGLELWRSPYGAVEWAGVDYEYTTVLGIPMVNIAQGSLNGQWFWIQTWGLCLVCPGAASVAGDDPSERMVVFDGQGQLANFVGDVVTGTKCRQIAGYIVDKTKDAFSGYDAAGSVFIRLMLDP